MIIRSPVNVSVHLQIISISLVKYNNKADKTRNEENKKQIFFVLGKEIRVQKLPKDKS